MKAVVLDRYGPPDVLQVTEVPKPEPGDDEVQIRVHVTAVNDYDWALLRGRPYLSRLLFGLRKPRVSILGAEIAGRVEACGANVNTLAVGDDVYGDISESGFGGFAEFVCVHGDAVVRMPSGMTYDEAASLPHAAMLAWQGLVDRGEVAAGERVLINGAGGGVGTVGVQIARRYGAITTGVDSADKLDSMRELGFAEVLDYRQQDFTRQGARYDLILDAKTSRSPWRHARALRPGGRYVTVGGSMLRLLQTALLGRIYGRWTGKSFSVVALKPNKDLARINAMFEAGQLRCLIDGPYDLDEVSSAVQYFGDAQHRGKVVINVVSTRPPDP
jgi:NADPH:quinone reductase-like Zn-dependent oxidoreductase